MSISFCFTVISYSERNETNSIRLEVQYQLEAFELLFTVHYTRTRLITNLSSTVQILVTLSANQLL